MPAAKPGVDAPRAQDVIGDLQAVLLGLQGLPDALWQLGDEGLTQAMAVLLASRARSEQLAALIAAEAAQRGTVASADAASMTQWVQSCAENAQAPVDPRDAHAIGVVAQACATATRTGNPGGGVAGACLRHGTHPVGFVKTALTHAARTAPLIPGGDRQSALAHYLTLTPSLGSRGVHQLTRMVLARFAPDRLDRADGALESTETLTWSTTATGMARLVAELAPVNAAIVKDAIMALSAPAPAKACPGGQSGAEPAGQSGGPSGGEPGDGWYPAGQVMRDSRTPGKRRADALVSLVSTAARVQQGAAGSLPPAARVVVTVPLSVLTDGLGTATTRTGELLDPVAARRLACDAGIIPAVLGSQGQVLDIGREDRLATTAIRTAVMIRDQGCTFPGCDRPPQFCEVHHIQHWAHGGDTSVANSAMLCTTHHQTVHRQGYFASTAAGSVEWDLTPGQLPTKQGRRAS